MPNNLIDPHGGKLVDLIVSAERQAELKRESRDWPSWDLSPRQLCDLELLINSGFSPLDGFLKKEDYESVCSTMRLSSGTLWPIPITLDVNEQTAKEIESSSKLVLRDPEGIMLAILHVEDIWQPDLKAEADSIFGTTNTEHPGVHYTLKQGNACYVGGRIEGLQLPLHYDFQNLRLSPQELRNEFKRLGWRKVVAFQTRNPLHRAHYELTQQAAKEVEASLLIHPVVGMTKPGDLDHYTRVRCYQAIAKHYTNNTARLSLLPIAMRMAGPREAVWHAIIRKNYGCTHLIVGRDHAGPGADSSGTPFYGPYDAQELLRNHEEELGVSMVPFKMMVYVKDSDSYMSQEDVPTGSSVSSISGTELRERLAEGKDLPAWFTFPEVATELRKTHPPRAKQGFTVFFTGLSGSGKSTIANVLLVKLLELGGRPVTLLDGDVVRKNLSKELGFSKEHRDINIRRIGYVASEITKNGGIALCAPIAPYSSVRKEVKDLITPLGGFVLVHIATPLEECEKRDRKGMYAKARQGIIKEFTGISDPYEEPEDAALKIDTTNVSAEEAAQDIILHLKKIGFIGPEH